jgi:hypothetical protein
VELRIDETTRVIRRKYSGERKKTKEKSSEPELEPDQHSEHSIDHNPHRSITHLPSETDDQPNILLATQDLHHLLGCPFDGLFLQQVYLMDELDPGV